MGPGCARNGISALIGVWIWSFYGVMLVLLLNLMTSGLLIRCTIHGSVLDLQLVMSVSTVHVLDFWSLLLVAILNSASPSRLWYHSDGFVYL